MRWTDSELRDKKRRGIILLCDHPMDCLSGTPYPILKTSDHELGAFEASGKREEFVVGLWEAILSKGSAAPDYYAGVPATAQFSLSSPALLPRVRKLGPIRPFTFLTARFLEPSADPLEDRSELVAFVSTKDETARAELMQLPRQRSWGSVLEAFVRHRDRKCTFDTGGRMVRRQVLIRKSKIVGLGKEANRVEDSRVLGLRTAGGRAKTYVDPDPFKGSATEVARRLGVSRRTVYNLRRRRKAGRTARDPRFSSPRPSLIGGKLLSTQ